MSRNILIADKISPEGMAWLESREGVTATFMPGQDEDALWR